MEAAAGLGAPPELRLLRTRREGASVRTTVLVALPPGRRRPGVARRSLADPALGALLDDRARPGPAWTWTTRRSVVHARRPRLGVFDVA